MTRETVDALLTAMLGLGDSVSDLLFVSGKPPLAEIHGWLREFPIDTPGSVLDPTLIKEIADHITGGDARLAQDFQQLGACDCSYSIENVARFRVNIFKQSGRHAIAMRRLTPTVPTLDELKMPPVFREILKEKHGIVLVTGSTGSGKSTTLAALINELNESEDIHIVTLEDPIEFQHKHKRAAINQRELGVDFNDFASGLRSALRQAPKVILVGEIRDRDSMEIAMSAAETGHVVYSTLHTTNAGQTISRIIGMFSREEEPQLRQRLSETLRWVASQRLVEKAGGGRLLVTEVMGSSLRTREAIVYGEGENKTFHEIMEAGSTMGWHTFDQSLLKAVQAGQISDDTALMYSNNKGRMRRDLDNMAKGRGADVLDAPSGLKLHFTEPLEELPETPATSSK